MNAIEVEHLVKRFGTVTAVNDVSLTVPEGETFGFPGPNGKKTLLPPEYSEGEWPDLRRVSRELDHSEKDSQCPYPLILAEIITDFNLNIISQ